TELPTAEAPRLADLTGQPYPHSLEEVYRSFLFHGPDLQGLTRVEGLADTGIAATTRPAPPPAQWVERPLRRDWLAEPLALDCAFQAIILWCFAQHGAAALPVFVGRYRQSRRAFPSGGVKLVARITKDTGGLACADVEFLDPVSGRLVARLADAEVA